MKEKGGGGGYGGDGCRSPFEWMDGKSLAPHLIDWQDLSGANPANAANETLPPPTSPRSRFALGDRAARRRARRLRDAQPQVLGAP
jgi:hypothetical protein